MGGRCGWVSPVSSPPPPLPVPPEGRCPFDPAGGCAQALIGPEGAASSNAGQAEPTPPSHQSHAGRPEGSRPPHRPRHPRRRCALGLLSGGRRRGWTVLASSTTKVSVAGSRTRDVPVKPVWPAAPRPASSPMNHGWSMAKPRPGGVSSSSTKSGPRMRAGPYEPPASRVRQKTARSRAVEKRPAWPGDPAERPGVLVVDHAPQHPPVRLGPRPPLVLRGRRARAGAEARWTSCRAGG